MNKKIGLFALAALILGAGGSIALQSFAQTPAPSSISATTDQSVDQKDQNGNDVETNDDASSKVTLPVKVSEDQARQTALAANPGATVSESDLEQHGTTVAYEISLSNGVELKIDAATGAVMSSNQDKADGQNEQGENGTETNDGPDQGE